MSDIDKQRLVRLKLMEKTLINLLQKIDTEINKTDIEWLHLKSLTNTESQLAADKNMSQDIKMSEDKEAPENDLIKSIKESLRAKLTPTSSSTGSNFPNTLADLNLDPTIRTMQEFEEFDSD